MRNFKFTMRQSDKRSPRSGNSVAPAGPTLENLEPRALFSVTGLSLAQVPYAGSQAGSIVSSYGNGGDDAMGACGNKKIPPPPKFPSVDFDSISVFSNVSIVESSFLF